MICKNCGNEIPDTSTFCGYCGTSLKEETQEPVSLAEEPASEELPAGETVIPEEPAGEPEIVEKAEITEEKAPEVQEEIPAGPKKENKAAQLAKNAARSFMSGFKGEEFLDLLKALTDPFTKRVPAAVPSVCACLLFLIITLLTLPGHAGMLGALLFTVIAWCGTMVILLLNRDEKFNPGRLFCQTAGLLLVPMAAMIIMCIIRFAAPASAIKSELITVLCVFALTVYIISVTKNASRIKPYILVILITVLILGLIACLFGGAAPAFQLF